MPVIRLPWDELLRKDGEHVASEPHLRLQIIKVANPVAPLELFQFHGELLILCLSGAILVNTKDATHQLNEGDQVLLISGEPFALSRRSAEDSLVQFAWAPGPNPCGECSP